MDERPPERQPTKHARRRRRRVIVWVALCALGAWLARFAYLRVTLRPNPRPEYWARRIAALDPPPERALSPGEADAILLGYPDYPGTSLPSWKAAKKLDDLLCGDWTADRADVAAVRDVLVSDPFQQGLARLREATRRGWAPGDVATGVSRPWFSRSMSWRVWGRWLLIHSRGVREELGDSGAAAEDWLTALQLGRQGRRAGGFMAWHREARLVCRAAVEMIYASAEGTAVADTAALAAAVDGIVASPLPVGAVLEGERLHLLAHLDRVYVAEPQGWLSIADAVAADAWRGVTPSRLWNLASPLFHDRASATAGVQRFVDASARLDDLAACHRVPPDAPALLSGLDGSWLAGPLSPRWTASTLSTCFQARCTLDAALTVLALAEHHEVQGVYPAALDELIPAFLPRLPVDYADRQPLRYRRSGDGYLLYSIGPEGIDDGGAGRAGRRVRWTDTAGQDVLFSDRRRPEFSE